MDKSNKYSKNISIITLCCLCIISLYPAKIGIAQINYFSVDKEFLTPISLNSYQNKKIPQLFQNPSSLSQNKHKQALLMIHKKSLAYNHVHSAFLWPLKTLNIGMTLSHFGTNSLINTPTPTPFEKPQPTGTFSHQLNTVEFSLCSAQWNVNPSLKITYLHQRLESDHASGMNIDLGTQSWINKHIWIGAYTRHLTKTTLYWKTSPTVEEKKPDIIIESGIKLNTQNIRISLNKEWLRISNSWQHKNISIQPDILYQHNTTRIKRLGLGFSLSLQQLDILYHYLYYPDSTTLKKEEIQLGIMWSWT
ncbi:MAG: hypothetical protein VW378_04760 [bacterium]